MTNINIELAKLNPASVFKKPQDVLKNQVFTKEQKIDILKRWAYDERELAVAEEENMLNKTKNQTSMLHEILTCLLELGIRSDEDHHPPTKQG